MDPHLSPLPQPTRDRRQPKSSPERLAHAREYMRKRRAAEPAFLYRLALAGHGVVIGPSFALGADVADGRLVPLLTEWRSRELLIHALYPHRLLLSAKI